MAPARGRALSSGTYQERDGIRVIHLMTTDNGATWVDDPGGGNIVESPDGTQWRVTVTDAGVATAVAL